MCHATIDSKFALGRYDSDSIIANSQIKFWHEVEVLLQFSTYKGSLIFFKEGYKECGYDNLNWNFYQAFLGGDYICGEKTEVKDMTNYLGIKLRDSFDKPCLIEVNNEEDYNKLIVGLRISKAMPLCND